MGTCLRCPCGGHYEKRTVDVRFARSPEPVVLTGVEQCACSQCGGRVYAMETLERLEALHRGELADPLLRRLRAAPAPAPPR